MKHYWISIYRPDGYDPKVLEDETTRREIHSLNQEMVAAGVRVFVGGLTPPEQGRRHLQPHAPRDVRLGFLPAVGGTWEMVGDVRITRPECD